MNEHVQKTIEAVAAKIARLQDLLQALHELQAAENVPCGTAGAVKLPAKPTPQSAQGAGPSVADMVLAAAHRITEKTPEAVFDKKTLVNVASEMHPTRHTHIKLGIYNAVSALKKRGLLKLAPGGFALSPGRQAEWEKLRAEMGIGDKAEE